MFGSDLIITALLVASIFYWKIIPICASCKKIKDDQGYWNELEQYIETHADVQFSHGLCASCADKLYAGQAWYESTKNER